LLRLQLFHGMQIYPSHSHSDLSQILGMTYGAPPGSTEPTYMMALEWCDGDLEGVVLDRKKHPEFTMKTALELATGVACGMAYIHRKDVLHLDIKMVRDPCWQRFCCD
jgi:serine/threonine protein kinase